MVGSGRFDPLVGWLTGWLVPTWTFPEPWQEIVPERAGGRPRPSPRATLVRIEDEVLRLIFGVDGPVHVICHGFP